METLDVTVRELRLAEQAILKEALEKKDERVEELQAEVNYLRRLLNETLAVPRLAPAALAAGPVAVPLKKRDLPLRWRPQ